MLTGKSYQVLDGNYAGLNGWRAIYRVVSNAKPITGMNPAAAGVLQDVAVDTIPAFQFAIFYNGQLEFTQCAPLTIRGRTHANGPICMGAASGNTLSFQGLVTTTASIVVSNLGGYSGFATPVYSGTPSPGYKTGVPTLKLPIGTNDNSAASVREIINLPPSGELASTAMGQQRFYNKAGIVLLVSNATVTLTVKDQGAGTGTTTNWDWSLTNQLKLQTNMPFLSVTNRFYDQREGKWVMPTQIDMGKLKSWVLTNKTVTNKFTVASGTFPNIIYVADFRTNTSLASLYAVRLTNGIVIPTNAPISGTNAGQPTGLTIATINPLYVWGNYNCPNNAHLGSTNTSATFPASLVCDALTVLSSSWKDSYSNSVALSSRGAADTTINAAIISGNVYTTGTGAGNWSGGVHNQTRLLESWTGCTLTLNTSLVNLFDSVRANTQFQNPGIYYNAPTRNFNFDQNFLTAAKLPPGTPTIAVISRAKWTTTPINNVTYNGP